MHRIVKDGVIFCGKRSLDAFPLRELPRAPDGQIRFQFCRGMEKCVKAAKLDKSRGLEICQGNTIGKPDIIQGRRVCRQKLRELGLYII